MSPPLTTILRQAAMHGTDKHRILFLLTGTRR